MENDADADASPIRSPFKEVNDEKVATSATANLWAPESFPDGGLKAWLNVAGCSACLFCSFGWVNSLGIWQDYYIQHQLSQYTESEVSWISAFQLFLMFAAGPLVGKSIDDHGPALPLAAGTALQVFGLMMASISTEYYQILLSQAICSSLGASMVFYPAFGCTMTWFHKKRGLATGLVSIGSSLGGLIFPIAINQLIPEVGYGWTMRICAFVILALLLFANLTVRSRIPPSKRPFRLQAFLTPLKEVPFLLSTLAMFFFFWGIFIPLTYIVVEARAKGMSQHLASYLVPILNAASILGRSAPNILSDRYGRFNVMILMCTFTTVIVLALWLPATGNAALIVFAILFGIGSGAGIGLAPALIGQVSPIQEIGARVGSACAFASIAALTGAPIGGAILASANGDFRYTAVFAGITCAIGTALYLAARIQLAGVSMKAV